MTVPATSPLAALLAKSAASKAAVAATSPAQTPAAAPTAQAVQPVAPTPAPVPAPQTELTTSVASNQAEALNALAVLFGQTADEVSTTSLFDDLNGLGSADHTLPVATLKKAGWSVSKQVPADIAEFMPSGDRAFTTLYLAYRTGYKVWPFSNRTDGQPDGRPPMARGVIPGSQTYTGSIELTRRCLGIGSRIQFAKLKPETLKAANLGKLTPELQVLGWTPRTGFIILSIPGFTSAELSVASLDNPAVSVHRGIAPLIFSRAVQSKPNKKAGPTAPPGTVSTYDNTYISVLHDPSQVRTREYAPLWQQYAVDATEELAKTVMAFRAGEDYNGDSIEATEKLLARYEMCPIH